MQDSGCRMLQGRLCDFVSEGLRLSGFADVGPLGVRAQEISQDYQIGNLRATKGFKAAGL